MFEFKFCIPKKKYLYLLVSLRRSEIFVFLSGHEGQVERGGGGDNSIYRFPAQNKWGIDLPSKADDYQLLW